MEFSVAFAILGFVLLFRGLTLQKSAPQDRLRGIATECGWQLRETGLGFSLSGMASQNQEWILRTAGSGKKACTQVIVGRSPIPTRVAVVVPHSTSPLQRGHAKGSIGTAEKVAARFPPEYEGGGPLYAFAIGQSFADQFRQQCSRDLELALCGLYLLSGASVRPTLTLYAGRRGIAVTSDRPVVKPAAVVALVHFAFAAAECLTGWASEAGDRDDVGRELPSICQ